MWRRFCTPRGTTANGDGAFERSDAPVHSGGREVQQLGDGRARFERVALKDFQEFVHNLLHGAARNDSVREPNVENEHNATNCERREQTKVPIATNARHKLDKLVVGIRGMTRAQVGLSVRVFWESGKGRM